MIPLGMWWGGNATLGFGERRIVVNWNCASDMRAREFVFILPLPTKRKSPAPSTEDLPHLLP